MPPCLPFERSGKLGWILWECACPTPLMVQYHVRYSQNTQGSISTPSHPSHWPCDPKSSSTGHETPPRHWHNARSHPPAPRHAADGSQPPFAPKPQNPYTREKEWEKNKQSIKFNRLLLECVLPMLGRVNWNLSTPVRLLSASISNTKERIVLAVLVKGTSVGTTGLCFWWEAADVTLATYIHLFKQHAVSFVSLRFRLEIFEFWLGLLHDQPTKLFWTYFALAWSGRCHLRLWWLSDEYFAEGSRFSQDIHLHLLFFGLLWILACVAQRNSLFKASIVIFPSRPWWSGLWSRIASLQNNLLRLDLGLKRTLTFLLFIFDFLSFVQPMLLIFHPFQTPINERSLSIIFPRLWTSAWPTFETLMWNMSAHFDFLSMSSLRVSIVTRTSIVIWLLWITGRECICKVPYNILFRINCPWEIPSLNATSKVFWNDGLLVEIKPVLT